MSIALPPVQVAMTPTASPSRSYWRVVARQLRREPVAMAAAFVLLLIAGAALFAPWVAPHDPYKASMLMRLKPIGTEGHLLGTDELGRDLLSRLIHGGRQSLLMGVVPVLTAFVIGSSLGLLALTLVFVPQVVRVAESVTTQVRRLDYIEAARMSGAGPLSIIRVHVLGNVRGPVFVYTTGLLSVSMILASGLSFLGLGVKPPEPEWGLMLNTLRSAIYLNPWVAALPGACIFVTSIAFNLLADGVRSAMDIRR